MKTGQILALVVLIAFTYFIVSNLTSILAVGTIIVLAVFGARAIWLIK